MTKSKLSILFSVILLLLFSCMAWTATGYQPLASYFPLYLSIIGSMLAIINIVVEYRKQYASNTKESEEEQQDSMAFDLPVTHKFKAAAINFLWVMVFFALIFLFGFMLAAAIFLIAFFKTRTDYNWFKIGLSVVLTIGVLVLLGDTMGLKFPEGMVQIF